MLHHVHVYRVTRLCEVDVEAESEEDARMEALAIATEKSALWRDPDCKTVAVGPWLEDRA